MEEELKGVLGSLRDAQKECEHACEERDLYRRMARLDVAMEKAEGALQLDGDLATWGGLGNLSSKSLWSHLSWHTLNAERNRRVEQSALHAAAMDAERSRAAAELASVEARHASEAARLKAEIEDLRRALAREHAKHHLTASAEPLEERSVQAVARAQQAARERLQGKCLGQRPGRGVDTKDDDCEGACEFVCEGNASGAEGEGGEAEAEGAEAEAEGGEAEELVSRWRLADLFSTLGLPHLFGDAFETQLLDGPHAELAGPHAERPIRTGNGAQPLQRAGGAELRAVLGELVRQQPAEPAHLEAIVCDLLQSTPVLTAFSERLCEALRRFAAEEHAIERGLSKATEAALKRAGTFTDPDSAATLLWAERARGDCPTPEVVAPQARQWTDPSWWLAATEEHERVYGDRTSFLTSISELLGMPATDGLPAMAREHVLSFDADVLFLSPSLRIKTTSKVEWGIVVDPALALAALRLPEWERGALDDAGEPQHGNSFAPRFTPRSLGSRLVAAPSSAHFAPKIQAINDQLAAAGDAAPLSLEAFVALRLYTGPCFVKYHLVLRGASKASSCTVIDEFLEEVCKGNTYVTTIVQMGMGVDKLSRLSRATPVYRVPAPGKLPPCFLTPSANGGVPGGVELSFTRYTSDLEAAKEVALAAGATAILEVKQGLAARGARCGWLSQFPSADAELVLFGPQLALEVRACRTDGAFLLLELQPSASAAAERSRFEMDELRAQELLMQRLCCDEGQKDLQTFAGTLDLKRDTTLELTRRGVEGAQSEAYVKAKDLARANQLRRRLRAEAAAFALAEAVKDAERVETLAQASGSVNTETRSMVVLAKARVALAEQKEERARTSSWGLAARERGIAELEAAASLDG